MIAKQELMDWLGALPRNSAVYVDKDGITLCASDPGWTGRPCLEVGGNPEEDE